MMDFEVFESAFNELRVEQIIDHLDQLPSEPRTALRFSPEARVIFNAWYTRHMQQSRSGNFTRHCNHII